MLTDMHPIVRELDKLPYSCTLVGSRGLGLHHERSDYDYLLALPEVTNGYKTLEAELVALGFEAAPGGAGYGPDPKANLFVWKGKPVPVDVIVVSQSEYDRRLRTIDTLRSLTNDVKNVGSLYRGLKEHKAWPLFWALIRKLDTKP